MVVFLDLIDDPADKNKFELLYEKYNRLAYWIADKKVHNHELAEECVQETFLSLARNFHKVGEVNSKRTRSYVATIAQGFAIKAYNRENRAIILHVEDNELEEIIMSSEEDTVLENVDVMDLKLAVEKLLNDEERNVIELVYSYRFSVSELARMFNTTNYYVYKPLKSALEKLKRYFEKED